MLQQKQYDLKHKQHHLVQCCHKVVFKLLHGQRVLEQQHPLSAALLQLRRDLIPPDAEISTMNKFVEIMKPFVDMTEGIGGEKWVTISSVRPLTQKITSCFLQTSNHDHSQGNETSYAKQN